MGNQNTDQRYEANATGNPAGIPGQSGPIILAVGGGPNCGTNTTPVVGGTYSLQVKSIRVPGGLVGINGQVDIQFAVGAVSDGTGKGFSVTFGGVTIGIPLSITTNATTIGTIRVRASGVTNSQVVSVLNADGQTTTAFQTLSMDMTIDQLITFWMNAASTATLQGYQVTVFNPPAPPTRQLPIFPSQPALKTFYGANSHPGYYPGVSAADHVSLMKFMGLTVLRLDWEGTGTQTAIAAIADAFVADGTGLQICCVLGTTGMNGGGSAYANEAAAYAANKSAAQAAAAALIPHGVVMWEAANEMDASGAGATQMRVAIVAQGTNIVDYNPSIFPLFRGAHNGAIDGIRAAATSLGVNVLVGCNAFTNASILLSDALWNGTNLDGTPGFQISRWDFTNWHTYGNATLTGNNTQYSGGGGAPHLNLLKYVSEAYGVPVFITEYNPSLTPDSANATATTAWLTEWYGDITKYNLGGVYFYDIFDSPYNMFTTDVSPWTTSTINLTGAAVRNFIAANPTIR